MQRMLKRLGIASFRREALGIWDDAALDQSVIDADKFAALKADVDLDGSPSFGIRFSADGARMAMAIAVPTSTGKAFVEVLDSASTSVGLASVTAWMAQCWRDSDAIVIDGKAMAGLLTEELRTAGVPARKIVRPSSDDVGTASARLVALVKAEQIAHAGQPGLVYTAGRAARRPIGVQGLWGFRALNADADVDIPALEAVALAISGLKERPNSAGTQSDDNQRSRSRGGRKATVM